MERKDLKAIDFTDPEKAIDAIMALHGQDEAKHKQVLEPLTAERDTLKTQVEEAGATIKSYKDMNIDEIKKNAADWENKAKEAQTALEQKTARMNLDRLIEGELQKTYGAIDPTDVMLRLNYDSLKHDAATGAVIGLKEQVEPLQKSKAHLFGQGTSDDTPRIVTGPDGKNQTQQNSNALATTFAGAIAEKIFPKTS